MHTHKYHFHLASFSTNVILLEIGELAKSATATSAEIFESSRHSEPVNQDYWSQTL